ncbi:hypothetical protein F5Y19DRAFT_160839 [Xylariaceae sp. FL1651]|nr:hypothetical protein F5Y19DRAFT_160839 [Xylariaceae sp. FL1651]
MFSHEQQHEEEEQTPRLSRYRNLRKQSVPTPPTSATRMTTSDSHEDEIGQQPERSSVNSIARSMSRYRRRANSVSTDSDAMQTVNSDSIIRPPVPTIPPSLKTASSSSMARKQREHEDPAFVLESPPRRQLRHTDAKRRTPSQPIDDCGSHASITYDRHRDRIVMADRDTREPETGCDKDSMSWQAERDRMLAEQKRKDLQRLEEQLANSQRVVTQSHKPRSPVVEKFVLLTRGRKSKDGLSPTSSTTLGKSSTRKSGPEFVKSLPAHIEPGGKGIVPQTDAPTSAINAGDRNVTVRCRHHTFCLPVTPETTTLDILTQTSGKITYDLEISPENCVVVEQYGPLGLERRLRQYEHIREVMNSWDRDVQNQLVVILTDANENHEDLDVSSVPDSDDTPSGCQVYMYHSNRPGKWNKRWVTLLDNGQIVCAKKQNAKPTDKDTTGLCHLSDYDIYTPTESQMRRHIKPPKRYCFAVKSQQKTTVFLNTENYVQYFSTEDPQVARQFRERVHGWRSWYLVDRRPEVRRKLITPIVKAEENPPQITTAMHAPKKAINVASLDGHRLRVSVDEAPYAIGQFQPLLDLKRFDKRLSQFGKDFLPPTPDPSTMPKANSTISRRLSKRETRERPDPKPPSDLKLEGDDGFTGGLLGEGYEGRKQALTEATDTKKRPQELAFTEGSSLLNGQLEAESPTHKPESPSWFPSALEHSAKQRTSPSITASRPKTSAGVVTERRLSLTATTRRPVGPATSTARPSTQHSSQHPHPHLHTQHHPNPLGSQPVGTGLSQPNRRGLPKPLIDITPTIQEPPQWSKDKVGHGVKLTEGLTHLIDMISVGNGNESSKPSGLLEVPPRSALRRPPQPGSGPLARTRSKSSGSASGRPLIDDIPPVPSLPSRLGSGPAAGAERGPATGAPRAREGGDRREAAAARDAKEKREQQQQQQQQQEDKARHRDRERGQREREYREREAAYNAVPGRTGTLKVV